MEFPIRLVDEPFGTLEFPEWVDARHRRHRTRDRDHMELQQPLYEYIQPEALDTVVTSQDDVTLGFDIDSYRIRIDGDDLRVYGD